MVDQRNDELRKYINMFGLDSEIIQSILECAVNKRIRSTRIKEIRQIEGNNYGYQGEKIIPVFTYESEAGEVSEIEMFAKRLNKIELGEEAHYHYLASYGVPVPRFFGAFRNVSGEEILFIERLSKIGADFKEPSELKLALRLLAKINSLPISDKYRSYLPPSHKSKTTDLDKALHLVWEYAANGEIGDDLKNFCKTHPVALYLSKAETFRRATEDLNFGLIHDDFHKGNIGFNTNGEIVIFDLNSMSCGPRFWDIARIYGSMPKERYSELVQGYLFEYLALNNINLSEAVFFEELDILHNLKRMTYVKIYLNWSLSGKNGMKLPLEEGKKYQQRILLNTLASFL
ncbi:phosphotransferase [Paenibacillus sp. NPDC056579]|uniref:phosphotransferase n=1 Tax=Paenibacillus sp. NPDC056579 TaxID=3345871 RepID=UPI00369A2FF8